MASEDSWFKNSITNYLDNLSMASEDNWSKK